MNISNQIFERMRSHNTLLCCGLDPDIRKIPIEIIEKYDSDEKRILEFLYNVIDITAEYVCVYKIQKAFFDILSNGHEALRKTINYIHLSHPGIPVIIDCKIGDIANTMSIYIENIFGLLQADGVVVNPYFGDDVIMPLAKLTNKATVVLVKTSNPSGDIVQNIVLQDGRLLWQNMLDLVVNRWNYNSNMIPILSSTIGPKAIDIRSLIPKNMPILLAGIGAQGGDYTTLRHLLNSDGLGVFVNSSRNILYPINKENSWQNAIKKAAIELKEALNKERG
jgi:orotidine-5'-phosphate decarboxylase